MTVVQAAGGVVMRQGAAGPEVALVHRPKYRDWTLPKGKHANGETAIEAAVREVKEETGLSCTPIEEVASVLYGDRDRRPKVCRYWRMQPDDPFQSFSANNEVDALEWLTIDAAHHRLSYARDADVLDAAAGRRVRTTHYLVRHVKAGNRAAWAGPDRDRPATKSGRRQAAELSTLLVPTAVRRVLSSPYQRCLDSVAPLADALGIEVEPTDHLLEGIGPDAPYELIRSLREPAVLCTHGDICVELVEAIIRRDGVSSPDPVDAAKGSVWVIGMRSGEHIPGDLRYVPAP